MGALDDGKISETKYILRDVIYHRQKPLELVSFLLSLNNRGLSRNILCLRYLVPRTE